MGTMKGFQLQILLVLILGLVAFSSSAGRKRYSPRPPFLRTTRSATRFSPRPTRGPSPPSNLVVRSRPAGQSIVPPSLKDLTQPEVTFPTCSKYQNVLADRKNPNQYHLCVPIRNNNWIIYTYKCPSGSEFRQKSKKCVASVPTQTPPSSTTPVPTIVEVVVTASTVSENDRMIESSSEVVEITEIVTEMDNMIHTSEPKTTTEGKLVPSSNVSATTTTLTLDTSPRPRPRPLSSFSERLINRGNNGPHANRFGNNLSQYLTNSPMNQILSDKNLNEQGNKGKPKTPSFNQGSDSDNTISAEIGKPARKPITRWKVTSVPDIPNTNYERFPGLRPTKN